MRIQRGGRQGSLPLSAFDKAFKDENWSGGRGGIIYPVSFRRPKGFLRGEE